MPLENTWFKVVLLLVSLCFSTSHGNEQESSQVEPDFVLQFRKIKESAEGKISAIYAEVEDKFDPTKSRDEQQELIDYVESQLKDVMPTASEEVFRLVEPLASRAEAAEPLAWVAEKRSREPLGHNAIELLKQHHLLATETVELTKALARSGHPQAMSLLQLQLKSNDLPEEHRPKITFSIARLTKRNAELAARVAVATDEQHERYRRFLGDERVEQMLQADSKLLEEQAIRLFEEIISEYPQEVAIKDVTMGALAKSAIFEIRNLRVGKPIPELAGEDLRGEPFQLSDYRGKVVLLSFWATWCGPCMAEIPHERELVELYQGKPFAVVGVNGDLDREAVQPALEKHDITWRSLWSGPKGPMGEIPISWHVNSWPTVYVVDHEGIIRGKKLSREEQDKMISELVAKAEAVAGRIGNQVK